MALDWKVISQRNWVKGLQATFSRFAQPQGILTRLSNLLYDFRGGLRTTDGSLIFSQILDPTDTQGPITELTLYSPAGQSPYYVGILKSQSSQIPTPVPDPPAFSVVGGAIASALSDGATSSILLSVSHGLTAESNGLIVQSGNTNPIFNISVSFKNITIISPTSYSYPNNVARGSGTGGSMTTGLAASIASGQNFTYFVTASDGQGGETPISAAITGASGAPNNAVTLSWAAVPTAVGYNVYGRIFGAIGQLNQSGNQATGLITGTSFVDLGGVPFVEGLPSTNTTQTTVVYRMDAPTFSDILGVFPSYFAPPLGGIPGASGSPTASPGAGASPQGGVVGATQPLPQIVQFANKLILALGNGFAPQEFLDPKSGGTGAIIPVGNTFTADYTDWQASVAFNQSDTIKDSVSGGIFVAQQAGTTGATRPTFNNTLNALTPELSPGTVVWKCTAVSFQGTPLRGAAHAIVYAGSLWLANTFPTTTSDQLDGPNCIKMSDVNNSESWNPANIAFLNKDDGDQITSLATFTIAEAGISPTGSLVIFKNFSTFQITGVFGAADLTIQTAQTDMGNVAGRSTQFIPGFGIMRLTHLGFAYFNGVGDKLTSEEIRPYLFGGQADIAEIDWNFAYLSKGAQAANPPMYLAACPVTPPVLTGVTLASASVGTSPLFLRVEKLVLQEDGTTWLPVSVTPEVQVTYNAPAQFVITTPIAQTGVKYRAFAGFVPGGENAFIEGTSFTAATVTVTAMTPGFPSLGAGGLTRIFAYDLVMKQWAIVDLPFPISALKQIRSPGTIPITVAGGASDGALRRLFAGDQTWDTGGQVDWSFRTGELFQQGGSAKVFYRRLVLRGSNALNSILNVTINLEGVDYLMATGPGKQIRKGSTQWQMSVDIMKDAENANAQISGSGPAQIQIESMDWYVKAKASGAPLSIQK